MRKNIILILSILIIIPFAGFSQNIPTRPFPPRLVNDLANVLSGSEAERLEAKLVEFNTKTSTQIAVVIVRSLEGYDRSEFATQIGHSWGVGQQGFDNGVVVLIKPRSGNQRGEAFIAVGYGLEPVITDAVSRRIIENEMIPYFRENRYYEGLNAATGILMGLASQEFSADDYLPAVSPAQLLLALLPLLIIVAFIVILVRSGSHQKTIGGKNTSLWTTLFLLSAMSSSRGSYGNFSSGRGSFGGGGFGGGSSFGGFGGGRFGGGGAGGSW